MSVRQKIFLGIVRRAGESGVVLTRREVADFLACAPSTAGRVTLDLIQAGSISRTQIFDETGGCTGVRYRFLDGSAA